MLPVDGDGRANEEIADGSNDREVDQEDEPAARDRQPAKKNRDDDDRTERREEDDIRRREKMKEWERPLPVHLNSKRLRVGENRREDGGERKDADPRQADACAGAPEGVIRDL